MPIWMLFSYRTEIWGDYSQLNFLIPLSRYWDPYYYRRRRVREEGGGMNFIESVRFFPISCRLDSHGILTHFNGELLLFHTSQVFSFVFGDGDPNQGIEEARWKLVIIEH